MPRYVKQRDKFGCGPTAVLNAMKWAGAPQATFNKLGYKLYWLCHCVSPEGTHPTRFDSALRLAGKAWAGFKVRRVRRPTLAEIEDHLLQNGSLILNYLWRLDDPKHEPNMKEREGRHYALVDGVRTNGSQFRIVNASKKSTAHWIDRKEFKYWELRFQRMDKRFEAWFLTRESQ